MLLTAEEWLNRPEYQDYTILDPDGWDRENFDVSWNEKISREEFIKRLYESTVMIRRK